MRGDGGRVPLESNVLKEQDERPRVLKDRDPFRGGFVERFVEGRCDGCFTVDASAAGIEKGV